MKRLLLAAIYAFCFCLTALSQNLKRLKDGEKTTQTAFVESTLLKANGSKNYLQLTAYNNNSTKAPQTDADNVYYSQEPGALSEGFSYILSPAITASQKTVGNPKIYNHPDTYKGIYWYTGSNDNGGVHTNYSVLGYWFYLLANGGTGTNDKGMTYNISGIGLDKSHAIAYRTLTSYLNAGSVYNDARKYAIQSAEDLYGIGSEEALQTAKAWDAVGVAAAESGKGNLLNTTNSIVR